MVLAALLAVAWDTMLSPVDVRSLTVGQRHNDGQGSVFGARQDREASSRYPFEVV